MNSVPFSPIVIDISTALVNDPRGNDGDYIILASSPAGSNVRVRLNSNTGPEVKLSNRWAIKAKDVKRFFVTCDAVSGGEVVFYQADSIEDFELITTPEAVQTVDAYGTDALAQLDKIINKFIVDDTYIYSAHTISTVIYNNIMNCHKLELIIDSGFLSSNTFIMNIKIDSTLVRSIRKYNANVEGIDSGNNIYKITLDNINGKLLTIDSYNTGAWYHGVIIKEYTLKP